MKYFLLHKYLHFITSKQKKIKIAYCSRSPFAGFVTGESCKLQWLLPFCPAVMFLKDKLFLMFDIPGIPGILVFTGGDSLWLGEAVFDLYEITSNTVTGHVFAFLYKTILLKQDLFWLCKIHLLQPYTVWPSLPSTRCLSQFQYCEVSRYVFTPPWMGW